MIESNDKRLYNLSLIVGGGGLMGFGLFILFGTWRIIPIFTDPRAALLFDTILCVLFFAQHSIMIRKRCKSCFCGFVNEARYPAFYSVASGAALLFFLCLWQTTPDVAIHVRGGYFFVLRFMALVAVIGFFWGGTSLKSLDPLGLNTLKHPESIMNEMEKPELSVNGPYRYVRHPLYSFVILMIWSAPYVTTDRLLFNMMFTLWIYLGAHWEEKDLTDVFGSAYEEYQKTTPMLMPSIMPYARKFAERINRIL